MNSIKSTAKVIEQDQGSGANRAQDLRDFAERLRSVSPQARKLLAHVAELAYHGRGQQRKADVAYLPELHESCGLDVDAMYSLLHELQAAKFIEVEEQYPFEDIRILPESSARNLLAEISKEAQEGTIPLRAILVDLQFETPK
jgi:hypothetical protein